MAARERARDAASARLRRAGSGALFRTARALPAALRRGQSAGRQLHHTGELFPHPQAADAARFPQAADHDDPQVAAAPQARCVGERGLHRGQPFPPHPLGPQSARRRRDAPAGARLGQARLRADGSARQGRRRASRDRPHRAALPVPVRASGQAPQGHAGPEAPHLGAGGAEEQRCLDVRRAAARIVHRRGGIQGHAAAICGTRRGRFTGDGARQAPCGGTGGLDCGGARS